MTESTSTYQKQNQPLIDILNNIKQELSSVPPYKFRERVVEKLKLKKHDKTGSEKPQYFYLAEDTTKEKESRFEKRREILGVREAFRDENGKKTMSVCYCLADYHILKPLFERYFDKYIQENEVTEIMEICGN
jgi:hypothetical protein